MSFLVLTVTVILLIIGTWGHTLPTIGGLNSSLKQYHLNMTSMWMTDEYGKMVEVYLTKRPHHGHIPLTSVEDNVFFFLYTREFNSAAEIRNHDLSVLKSSTFNKSRPTKIAIHGFMSDFKSDAVQIVREAYLNYKDVNVIAVDWSALAAAPWYVEATEHTEPVGKQVALLIDLLVAAGARVQDIHLLGHSLGAHVAGFASNHVTSGRITRITGLDPALPLFSKRPPEGRLDPSDADLVDCIHTCGGWLGFFDPLCTLDFYPNGGKASQPGCHWDIWGVCSHGRSYRYFGVTLATNFTARACSSISEVKRGQCSGPQGLMGEPAITSAPGLYYLETNSGYPYTKS